MNVLKYTTSVNISEEDFLNILFYDKELRFILHYGFINGENVIYGISSYELRNLIEREISFEKKHFAENSFYTFILILTVTSNKDKDVESYSIKVNNLLSKKNNSFSIIPKNKKNYILGTLDLTEDNTIIFRTRYSFDDFLKFRYLP